MIVHIFHYGYSEQFVGQIFDKHEKLRPGVNSVELLQVWFTSLAIVSEVENNSPTCKLHL